MQLQKEALELKKGASSSGDLQRAAEKYEEAIRIYQRVGDRKRMGKACNGVGNVYEKLGEYNKALVYYEKSFTINRELKDRKGEGVSLINLGHVYEKLGEYDKALSYYEKSLAIDRDLKDRKGEGISLTNIADVQKKKSQYDMALDSYEKSLAIDRELKDRKGESISLGNLAEVHEKNDEHDKAVKYYEKSLGIQRELRDRRGEGASLAKLGRVYWNWAHRKEAKDYYEKSLVIWIELKDRKGEAGCLTNLGLIHANWGEDENAVQYYEKSLAILRELREPKTEGQTLINLASVYWHRGQYDKAKECHERSLAIARACKDQETEREILMQLGINYWLWGRYAMAKQYYEILLAISIEQKNRKTEAACLANLSSVYSEWGQYEKAVDYYEKSLAIYRELKDRKGEALCLTNLGSAYGDWGQNDKAMECHEKCLAICRETKNRETEAIALWNRGQVLRHRGEHNKALVDFQKGLIIWTETHDSTNRPKALIADTYMDIGELAKAEPFLKAANYTNQWGRFYLLKSDFLKAREYYEKILKSAEENRNVDNLFTAYTGLGASCEAMKDDTCAAEHYEKAIKHTENIRSSLAPRKREKFFDVKIEGFSRTAPYEGLARVLLRQGKLQEAFKTTEYTRARVFAEVMIRMSQGKNLNVPEEIIQQDNSINNELAGLKRNLQEAFEKDNKTAIKSLGLQVKQTDDELRTHIKILREKYPLFAATKYPQPMDLSQTGLRENEWVLSYDVTDLGTLIYLTKGKAIAKALFKPVPRKEVDDLVRKFREPLEVKEGQKIRDQLKKFDFTSGKKLAEILLSDIIPMLPKDAPVIVIPGGSLGTVPFEMLVLNDGGKVVTDKDKPTVTEAEFFGDRNPISYYQSVTALTLARTLGKQKGAGQKVLVMDDPVFGQDDPRFKKGAESKKQTTLASLPDKLMSMRKEIGLTFPRLPLTGELGQSLKKLEPNKTDEFTGIQANKSALFEKSLNQYNSMVFATHGYFGKDLPGIMEPVLVLTLPGQPEGKDGFLRLSEVMGLKLDADIVALTACQTGLGRHISGEGTMGMGRAFQYAGSKSVLMSLWSVSEDASVKLVESFFKHMKEGKSKLEALRLARKDIRAHGYDHPFYWAPFILVGEVN